MGHYCRVEHVHAVYRGGEHAGRWAVAGNRVCGVDVRDSAVVDDHLIHAKVLEDRANTCKECHFRLFTKLTSISQCTL